MRKTAEMAHARDDLFVLEDGGEIRGTGILNKIQVDSYAEGHWEHIVPDEQVCVLHTLVIAPDSAGKGYGKAFIEYYEAYAHENGCTELRIDTNARNAVARAMYKKHGYTEIGIVPTVFNGIAGVQLVLLENIWGNEEGKSARTIHLAWRMCWRAARPCWKNCGLKITRRNHASTHHCTSDQP